MNRYAEVSENIKHMIDLEYEKIETLKKLRRAMYLRSLFPEVPPKDAKVEVMLNWNGKHTTMTVEAGEQQAEVLWYHWDFDAMNPASIKLLGDELRYGGWTRVIYDIKQGKPVNARQVDRYRKVITEIMGTVWAAENHPVTDVDMRY